MEVRYLHGKEKQQSRALYEHCFPEDTEAFVDYYYKEKCRDNRIAAAVEDERIIAMVHENPFAVSLCQKRCQVHYLVAVATSRSHRRKGCMRRLLERVLKDSYERKEPFSFLMPANPSYYTPFGYVYWNSQIEWRLEADAVSLCTEMPVQESEFSELAAFSNQVLGAQFDLYVLRDDAYYRRLVQEQKCENGAVMIVRNTAGMLKGSYCCSKEAGTEAEVREPIFMQGIAAKRHAVMMGRIVHLETFVQALRFAQPYEEIVLLKDEIIRQNNGCFRIRIDAGGGTAERAETCKTAKAMDIAELGQILFDQMKIFVNEQV